MNSRDYSLKDILFGLVGYAVDTQRKLDRTHLEQVRRYADVWDAASDAQQRYWLEQLLPQREVVKEMAVRAAIRLAHRRSIATKIGAEIINFGYASRYEQARTYGSQVELTITQPPLPPCTDPGLPTQHNQTKDI